MDSTTSSSLLTDLPPSSNIEGNTSITDVYISKELAIFTGLSIDTSHPIIQIVEYVRDHIYELIDPIDSDLIVRDSYLTDLFGNRELRLSNMSCLLASHLTVDRSSNVRLTNIDDLWNVIKSGFADKSAPSGEMNSVTKNLCKYIIKDHGVIHQIDISPDQILDEQDDDEQDDDDDEQDDNVVYVIRVNDHIRGYTYTKSSALNYIDELTIVLSMRDTSCYHTYLETDPVSGETRIYGSYRFMGIISYSAILYQITCERIGHLEIL